MLLKTVWEGSVCPPLTQFSPHAAPTSQSLDVEIFDRRTVLAQGALHALMTQPEQPSARYVARHRVGRQFGLNQDMAQACCDFSTLLL